MGQLLLALLLGCGSGNGGDSTQEGSDRDADGFFTPEDCDDTRPAIHPGAAEVVADGIDQDCDGLDVCHLDADGDGYGQSETTTATSCDDSGASANANDCDDSDAAFHPGAKELCDVDVDYNCDQSVEYADADSDGTAACKDCDDKNVDIHPTAEEVAANGVDEDCDGGDTCFVDADGDGFGTSALVVSADLDCADAGEADDSLDCLDAGDGAAETWPGAASQDSSTACMTDADGDGYGTDSPEKGVIAGNDCDDSDGSVTCVVIHVGNDVEFPDSSNHSPNYLLGSALEIPTDMIVTHLALIGKSASANVKMALYTDSGGAPDSLVAETASAPVTVGADEIPVLKETAVPMGHYWIMAVFDTNASVGIDFASTDSYDYRSMTFSNPMPSSFGAASTGSSQRYNYYAVGR
jgi:hypothetical protein